MKKTKLGLILILTVLTFSQLFAQNIDIAIRYLTLPEYPRGDYVPFSNCPRAEVSKLEFRVINRGDDFNKADKGLYGSIQIKRLSDGLILYAEEKVTGFKGFSPGWMKFRFDPIDLTQAGLYEVTVESYLTDLPTYIKDRTLKPIDSDLTDNKVVYLNRVFDPETLEKDKTQVFNFDELTTKTELAEQGWNYSYLPNSVRISNKGIGGSNALEINLKKGMNERKLFTPPIAVTNGAQIDLEFKLIDAKTGQDVTAELIASEGFKAMISFQDICSTGVKVTSTYSIPSARATTDGFFKFPFVLKYRDAGNYRGQIEFSNISTYEDVLLVIENVEINARG